MCFLIGIIASIFVIMNGVKLMPEDIDPGDRCMININLYAQAERQKEPELEEPELVEPELVEETALAYFGNCRITHYCNCSQCCGQWAGSSVGSSGLPLIPGYTVASSLPAGTIIQINGREYQVVDTGVSGAAIDIFCASHAEACALGMYYADVYIVE